MLFGSSKVLLLEEDFINFIVKVRDTVRGLRGVESMDHKVCVCQIILLHIEKSHK